MEMNIMTQIMKYANLSHNQIDEADALAQQIVAQLEADGSQFITVDDGFWYLWHHRTVLLDLDDQASYKKFLIDYGYLKPPTKNVGLVMQRLGLWSRFSGQRFETTDRRIEGMGVIRVPYFGRSRPTKRTYEHVKHILQNGYYILKGNDNDHD
jgi:hypothetical protein